MTSVHCPANVGSRRNEPIKRETADKDGDSSRPPWKNMHHHSRQPLLGLKGSESLLTGLQSFQYIQHLAEPTPIPHPRKIAMRRPLFH